MGKLIKIRRRATHKVLDRYTRLVLAEGTREECDRFARSFGLCYVEEV